MAKVMISIPDELLARIDERAAGQETSRSAWLATLAQRELSRATPDEIRKSLKSAQEAFAHIAPFDTAASVRKDRESRW